jgi:hypothetical protein
MAATVAPSSAYSPPPLLTPLLPRAAEALAAADRLEGVGWVFAPAGRGSGVAVLFYPAALVDVESYAVLATHLADLGHAAVLMATTEPAIQDPTGALARAAAGAARIKLGIPLAKIILAGNSKGGVAAMQALNASLSGADEALPMSEVHGLGLIASRASEGGLDLHNSGVRATLVTATQDRVLDSTALQETLHLLPKDLTHVSIVDGLWVLRRNSQAGDCVEKVPRLQARGRHSHAEQGRAGPPRRVRPRGARLPPVVAREPATRMCSVRRFCTSK